MKNFTFKGFMVPVFTPFKADKSLDLEVIPKYAEYLKQKGIDAILVNGTTGEGMSMTTQERKSVAEKWAVERARLNFTMMVQIGGTSSADVFELARHAESIQVDGVLILPQLYKKPQSEAELIEYLEQVATHCPNTPIFYYHIPKYTKVDVNISRVISLARARLPTFAGVKDSSANLEQIVHALDAGVTIFLGTNAIFVGSLALGFDSFIMTPLNIYPEMNQAIREWMAEGNVTAARQLQKELNEKIREITEKGEFTAAMKAKFNQIVANFGLNVGGVRCPLKDVHF
ncbi:N-acetylneuraminate lyase A-like [Culicoides brevitarsis]|uniref:N-acetylneuraminate lyase A-like n=1 Tax=Culicoides brevitarsis TaxID=469753 RepID=UPI00307C971A